MGNSELTHPASEIVAFERTDDILQDVRGIINSSRDATYRAIDTALIRRNWLIGYRISEEEMNGENRAEYGANVIAKLAKALSKEYGKGFTKQIFTAFTRFIKPIRRFSRCRLENLSCT